MRYMNKVKRLAKNRCKARGVAAVEFALLLILLLMIVAGIIEFGRTFWYYDALTKATRDGVRFLSNARASSIVAIDDALKQQAITMVVEAATAANVPNFSEDDVDEVDCDPNCNAPVYVTVSIDAYPVTIGGWIPFVTPTGATAWGVKLSPSTTMRYMCSTTGPC